MTEETKKWKDCANRLAWSLRRNPHYECGELDHSAGFLHTNDEVCPVVKMCQEALDYFDELSENREKSCDRGTRES
jgi:hypothetical protein